MNPKIPYFLGSLFFFLGLLWMLLPHASHGSVLEAADIHVGEETEENESFHHFQDILLGLDIVFLGLILIVYSEQKMKSIK